jgi:chromosome segregation ATPase
MRFIVSANRLVQDETIAMVNTDINAMDYYRQQGSIPKPVADALAKAIQLKQAMFDAQRQIDDAKSHLSDITTEQSRIRDNLKSVKDTTQYYTRLMTKLNDQENEIEKTQKSLADLQKQLDSQRSDFESYVSNLNV